MCKFCEFNKIIKISEICKQNNLNSNFKFVKI